MTNEELLHRCFGYLAKDLYRIENFNPDKDLPFQGHAINEIESQVFECDREDAILLVEHYQMEIDHLIEKVPALIDTLEIKDTGNPFDESSIVKAYDIKETKKNDLVQRLKYYSTELEKLKSKLLERQDALGTDRFASAGFKLRLNLTNTDIAHFFRALVKSGILIKQDGSIPPNVELASFITKNFLSSNGQDISAKAINNSLGPANEYSQTLRIKLKKLVEILNS